MRWRAARIGGVVAVALMTAACGTRSDNDNALAATVTASNDAAPDASAQAGPAPAPSAASTPIRTGSARPRSCAAEIGQAAAKARVAVCVNVSPATHPPCNVANSCAMIEDEIARACALFDGQGASMAGCEPAPKSMEAAADVVRRYYAAIDAGDYDTAWSQWGENGRPGQTRAAFQAGFARTRSTHVTIGALKPGEGAAGSIYQPVPVIVDATLDNGTRQRFRGQYVVRRINDVDGATPAQLRWHLDSAQLTPVAVAR
ncbi:hypothetical protein [Sphingomonas rubra]|uniref:Lipoprotein n=1 Tax=Sphingomonas rubra TaxID=634430 RepID=A0A1I5PN20_9SPHN|nr:hypothetical protein [Sphingomonas rubra]SFP35425.1 hypothetical protein SAMN04488241_101118 [Sphingomonas rubra]